MPTPHYSQVFIFLVSENLAAIAKEHKGLRTFNFNQNISTKTADLNGKLVSYWKKYKRADGTTLSGICASMCAYWILGHAFPKDGGSMWDSLFDSSSGNVNLEFVGAMARTQAAGIGQGNTLELMLAAKGLKRRITNFDKAAISEKWLPTSYGSLLAIAKAITEVNGYKIIEYDGPAGAHAVACWYDRRDVVFMDANVGEYWFPTAKAFQLWWVPYVHSVYAQSYIRMQVRHYVGSKQL